MDIIPTEDWEENIRTDLWNTMTQYQLNVQRDLIANKIGTLYKMPINDPTVQGLLSALNKANVYINELIDQKIQQDPKSNRTIR